MHRHLLSWRRILLSEGGPTPAKQLCVSSRLSRDGPATLRVSSRIRPVRGISCPLSLPIGDGSEKFRPTAWQLFFPAGLPPAARTRFSFCLCSHYGVILQPYEF